MVIIPPPCSKSRITVTSGQRHNNGGTTTTTNEGIFAFPNVPGRGQPLLLRYLPFCMGERPVSSVFCRPGALIFSYCEQSTIAETPLVRTNGILMVVYIALKESTESAYVVRKGIGVERGEEMQQSNGGWKGRGQEGGQVSSNSSIVFARIPFLYSRYTSFV